MSRTRDHSDDDLSRAWGATRGPGTDYQRRSSDSLRRSSDYQQPVDRLGTGRYQVNQHRLGRGFAQVAGIIGLALLLAGLLALMTWLAPR